MRKILLLVDKIGPRKIFEREYLASYLKPTTKVDLYSFSDVSIKIINGKVSATVGGNNITDYSLVYFKRAGDNYINLASALALILKSEGIRFVDACFSEIGAAGDKLNDIVKLALMKVSIPDSIYIDGKNIMHNKEHIVSEFGLPVLAKSMRQQRREGILLIEKKEEFDDINNKLKGSGFLIQNFLSVQEEYRVVVIGGKVIAVHREGKRRFKNGKVVYDTSESNEGFIPISECPIDVQNEAVSATIALGLDISGVDAAITEAGKVYIIEANRGPGFTHDDKISPELPELVKYFQEILFDGQG